MAHWGPAAFAHRRAQAGEAVEHFEFGFAAREVDALTGQSEELAHVGKIQTAVRALETWIVRVSRRPCALSHWVSAGGKIIVAQGRDVLADVLLILGDEEGVGLDPEAGGFPLGVHRVGG